jgi:hypothetical protein
LLKAAINSNDWDTDNFKSENLSALVSQVHICAYINEKNEGDEDGNPPTNHWATFLELETGGSVRLDMAPGYGSDGLRGKVEVSSKGYVSTRNSIKTLTFETNGQTNVKTVAGAISENGLEKYTFTQDMEGCRYWISILISKLEAAGILPSGSAKKAAEAVSRYWRNPTGSEPREVKKGTFR